AFRRAIRLLVKEHAYANAEWADLVGAFERASGRKLSLWADSWVKRRGMPDVRVKWSADKRGRISRLTVEQRDVLGEGGAWPMRVKLLLAPARSGRRPETLDVTLSGDGVTEVREAVGRRRPSFVFANHEDYGYGRFLLDDASRAAVLKNFGAIDDEFLRTLLWGALWEGVREAETGPLEYIDLAVRHAGRERDDVTLQSVLARVQTAYARYLSGEQQAQVAPRLEAWLSSQMLTAETVGLRITYYRTFREVATTPAAFDKLESILTGALQVPGMTLRSRDRFDIARSLLSRRGGGGDERAEALFKSVVSQDASDDGRRYAYAAEAARPVASVKNKYFDDFLNDPALAESWIEAAVGPFNTPRQSELTLPYLAPALRQLPTLKRTRKIFFVNGWLAAFLGGQCSPAALDTVNDFLRREPRLDRDLRLKVLEAADALERCVRVRARYASEVPSTRSPAP
ncbi:MAG TPA: ERAP1-like C-terminal domain-containing protein, partial [Pyrinomonadaceae bacterium]